MVGPSTSSTTNRWWRDLLELKEMPDPNEDGLTHINIYSKGRTQLGRNLSNFATTPFQDPDYGHFNSMEGFWYWAATGLEHDILRRLMGYNAKTHGRSLRQIFNPDFEAVICQGLVSKLECNPFLLSALLSSDLPLHHYYNYGGKVIVPDSGIFQVVFLEDYRRLFQTA